MRLEAQICTNPSKSLIFWSDHYRTPSQIKIYMYIHTHTHIYPRYLRAYIHIIISRKNRALETKQQLVPGSLYVQLMQNLDIGSCSSSTLLEGSCTSDSPQLNSSHWHHAAAHPWFANSQAFSSFIYHKIDFINKYPLTLKGSATLILSSQRCTVFKRPKLTVMLSVVFL